jgi:putative ABC transport system permease protein
MPPSNNKMFISIPKVDNRNEMAQISGLFVDYHFAETMGIDVLLGSDFDEEKANSGVLVNESAVKALGLTDIIGEQTAFGEIVGLVSDFNMYTLHEPIKPMIIGLNPSMAHDVAIKIRSENLPHTIEEIKKTWNKTGSTAFQYEFVDDTLKNLYESDIRLSKTIGLMSVIAIVIASLGLFGLSLFVGRQRTKEIGVRKVNGAKILEVTMALNMDFIKWVAIAFLIAIPLITYVTNFWLRNFAYKTEISWWIYALAGSMALIIAIITVSWQTFRAASRNPIDALRYE